MYPSKQPQKGRILGAHLLDSLKGRIEERAQDPAIADGEGDGLEGFQRLGLSLLTVLEVTGLEGEVRLILAVADDGSITAVTVALSSGHAILDKAAVRAAWSMGKVNWAHSRELILPVIFRLE